ncbi:MAG: hypothetical protein SFW67_21350 [Myxococcaceae bacterium]|nr:hypothetical protein [Myxococcaceae bacterium]
MKRDLKSIIGVAVVAGGLAVAGIACGPAPTPTTAQDGGAMAGCPGGCPAGCPTQDAGKKDAGCAAGCPAGCPNTMRG